MGNQLIIVWNSHTKHLKFPPIFISRGKRISFQIIEISDGRLARQSESKSSGIVLGPPTKDQRCFAGDCHCCFRCK